ncbi:MAG: alpha/beta hydrolase [Methylibium sp.]|uniref:alpha/beta hydrolase n=1 Tax=Methylibium sp. TaxID=2067992 RepID=UPI00180B7D6F|nr:alpha/beta fold hydrolase [Methylibium sp.]MBA3597676.1 alpha/beta hydrolase [Methylibium sp.]
MNAHTQRLVLSGPGGDIECAVDQPTVAAGGHLAAPSALMVICHPHPQHGGTLDNKVVQTLARAGLALGYRTVRFNFRGVGASAGVWDEGRGEIDDALAVIEASRAADGAAALPWVLAGFSFGGYVAASAAQKLRDGGNAPARLALIAPSTLKQTVPAVPQDTLVIHGEADDVVPLAATLDWARPQSLPVTVIPGVGHFFHGQLALLKSLVVRAWSQAL